MKILPLRNDDFGATRCWRCDARSFEKPRPTQRSLNLDLINSADSADSADSAARAEDQPQRRHRLLDGNGSGTIVVVAEADVVFDADVRG